MAYKKYSHRRRRRNSTSFGSLVTETGGLASVLRPRNALLVGTVAFVLLYWGVPALVEWYLADLRAQRSGPAAPHVDQVMGHIFGLRLVRPAEFAGIACLLLCSGIACWKAFTRQDLDPGRLRNASFVARLAARFLD